ncbi:hypothetical protein NUW58_g10562 [Xylaria curta]|uniref:Uncharacterized protein n=1 Tax=Xylaria curta TaxID=42375 RepID=A0ACC1MJ58_9PEZI|nr:hypothetical protein NUW58_g10562 [Xylaria curta]
MCPHRQEYEEKIAPVSLMKWSNALVYVGYLYPTAGDWVLKPAQVRCAGRMARGKKVGDQTGPSSARTTEAGKGESGVIDVLDSVEGLVDTGTQGYTNGRGERARANGERWSRATSYRDGVGWYREREPALGMDRSAKRPLSPVSVTNAAPDPIPICRGPWSVWMEDQPGGNSNKQGRSLDNF